MKILVTGGAGFIGSWVSEAYIEDGNEVLIIDNLSTGNLNNVPSSAEFIKGDIRDRSVLKAAFSEFNPDIINHHAAQIDVRKSVDDPTLDADINIKGTLNLLELSRKSGISKFIFASTGGAIYGEPDLIPADEDTVPMPISPYGISKFSIEKYLSYYNKIYGLNYTSLRYSNVYGPRQNPLGEAGVIAIFCNKIITGEPCIVYGDGEQTRDYVYVEDVKRANIECILSPNDSYNIGTSIETSVNGLIEYLRKASGRDFEVIYEPARDGEVERISLNNNKAIKEINWTPNVMLEEGIKNTWIWFYNK
ncbi:MAG: NAD-dependent epimerase/dehydratase family protein [Thermodesulfobacteriota bacterium]